MPKVVADYSKKRRSALYRIVIFVFALFLFLVLIPTIYLFIGKFINRWFSIPCPRTLELILTGITLAAGVLFMLWSVWTQWSLGRGGPAPVAPTQKLILSGPYACCRNPMHLGALLETAKGVRSTHTAKGVRSTHTYGQGCHIRPRVSGLHIWQKNKMPKV